MFDARAAALPLLAGLFVLVTAADAAAQACIGTPIRSGQMSLQGQMSGHAREAGLGYGGRLAINFNTPVTMDFAVQRPATEDGPRAVVGGNLAFEMAFYEPSICPYLGVRYELDRDPEERGALFVPIGLGFGKSIGAARGLSLSLFAIPEYMVRVNTATILEDATLFDELRTRSAGRGVVGLILGTPFVYGVGSVEVSTREQERATFVIGAGLIF